MKNNVLDPQSLMYDQTLKFKTSDGFALLIKIKDTESDFALIILGKDEDTIQKAYRMNNCTPNLLIQHDHDTEKMEISKELTVEFNCNTYPIAITDEMSLNIKKHILKFMFNNVCFYEGTKNDNCDGEYPLKFNEFIITDGCIQMPGQCVNVRLSTYVIIYNKTNNSIILFCNEPDIDINYDKITDAFEKISYYKEGGTENV